MSTNEPMDDATVTAASEPRRSSREFPYRVTGYIDEPLYRAISSASRFEHERESSILRRWLRFAARQSGYYPQESI